jgi:hypothetical protein
VPGKTIEPATWPAVGRADDIRGVVVEGRVHVDDRKLEETDEHAAGDLTGVIDREGVTTVAAVAEARLIVDAVEVTVEAACRAVGRIGGPQKADPGIGKASDLAEIVQAVA